MKKTLAAGLLAALTFLLAGCGSGGDDVAAQSISDSIMKEQKKSGSTTSQFFTMKQKDADCIGKGLVDKIGTDQLQTRSRCRRPTRSPPPTSSSTAPTSRG
jgi:hypothetical protein